LVERAIQLDSNQASIPDTRGAVLTDLQRYDEALIALDRAVQLDPQVRAVYYRRGLVYQKLGRTAEAEQDLQKARELGYEEEERE
jgi:tetratricopeptide (TPR) repeat protein